MKYKGFVHGIIPGHGGVDENGNYLTLKEDKKAELDDGRIIYEGQINRFIADQIITQAVPDGIKLVNVIPEVDDVPLSERVQRVNAMFDFWKKQDQLLIIWELHNNRFNGRVSGSEIFTTTSENFSDKMAMEWVKQKELLIPDYKLRKDIEDGDSVKEKDFYLIKNIKTFGCLIEFFFFDNPLDVERFCNNDGYHLLAKTVIEAMKSINQHYNPNKI